MRWYTLRLLLALGLAVASASAIAAVFNVDTTLDDQALAGCDDATPNDCSLRGAIVKANGLSEAVTINVPAGRYVLSQATPCFFRGNDIGSLFTTQALCPVGTLNLIGEGSAATIIDANQPSGNIGVQAPVMFVATSASVRIRGVTMQHGNFSVGSFEGHGGAINNAGTLVIEDSVVTDNFTSGAGGGIFNQRDLTILRSTITRNVSFAGGGGIVNTNLFGTCLIASPCHDGEGVLRIADSTISDNSTLECCGAGIFNFVGMVDITGSTISGNSTNGSGGGIANSAWNVNLTNVTVSGNRARIGGGLSSGGAAATMQLNNVTIANNTAQDVNDPSFGIGGGVLNGAFGTMTVANTIIAGNFAAGLCSINGCAPPGSDCATDAAHGGPLTSEGHNLIQDTGACDIVGDMTGNITGQDPKLGVLTDNGGWTLTHGIGDGSPATDAGNPLPPGSGGSTCAILDQRGFPRPLGGACDIGAFEHAGGSAIRITPSRGGSAGFVTALVSGNGFANGSTVKLARAGRPDIVGNPQQVDNGGSAISATFDLRAAAVGDWDVVVTRPDSSTFTLPGGFSVQQGGSPDLWVDVLPFVLCRHCGFARINIFYGNRGNVDAVAVPLQISASSQYGLSSLFAVTPPPPQPDQILVEYDQVPYIAQPVDGGYINVPLVLPVVPAGFTGTLQLLLFIPQPAPTDVSTLFVNIDTPYFNPTLSSAAVSGLVQGAMGYSPIGFATTVDPALVPALQQYVANQLQLLVGNGRTAFVASLGTSPQVYSHAQLVVDTAIVGAWRTLNP